MAFTHQCRVRFAHVDAAGIVFYPRYFEMVNAAVEELFAAAGCDFATLHLAQGKAVPTAHLMVDFTAPSRLGDLLDFTLTLGKLGRSSLTLGIDVRCGGAPRMTGSVTLVHIDLAHGTSEAWPAPLAEQLQEALLGKAP